MAIEELGSLTKEMPLSRVEKTIKAIVPGMLYAELKTYARENTHPDIPGLIRKRFLLVGSDERIIYDEFLSLVQGEGINSPITRKSMLFVWAYRDERIRRFITERIGGKTGVWSVSNLIDKANADFFSEWHQSGSAKARSNFERFLVETKIFDRQKGKIDLQLNDGWLEDAARIAAQHEPDITTSLRLRANPYEFLAERSWHALANATKSELRGRNPSLQFEAEPDEDKLIAAAITNGTSSKKWDRKKPKNMDKGSTQALIDLVARERANQSHHAIEKALVGKVSAKGLVAFTNENIDIFFKTENGSVIFEVKSCTQGNLQAQIRKGISQLLEYRFLYSKELKEPIHLALAIETGPRAGQGWLLEYLSSIRVAVGWWEPKLGQFKTPHVVPTILEGIFVK